mgnify:CR=1 FL=1
MHRPRFYFTVHPGDLIRSRLVEGAHIMVVASAHWDAERRRFRVRRPPADHVGSLCIDSGGFVAAQRWGRYPWSVAEYVEWIRAMSEGLALGFCAIMDYACEPAVNRSVLKTNKERIKATIRNEAACIAAAPDLPWLPVVQGDSLEERAFDLALRARLGLLPQGYAGIGSVCGRTPTMAQQVVKFYADYLPGVRFHGFGMHIQALDDDRVYAALRSWDSYCWGWGRGQEIGTPPREGETWSDLAQRMATRYLREVVGPRWERPRQLVLM